MDDNPSASEWQTALDRREVVVVVEVVVVMMVVVVWVCKMIQWMTSDSFLSQIQRHVRRCAVLMCTENDTRTCTCVQQKN